jgi:hypothetical protein
MESAGSVFFVFVACSCMPFFRFILSAVFSCKESGRRSAWGPRTVRGQGLAATKVLGVARRGSLPRCGGARRGACLGWPKDKPWLCAGVCVPYPCTRSPGVTIR